ncbi:MAG: MBL fold metallo-hydrolase [Lachnospiraceae bacterium]|nr:MBL fold metallo-hydrolase [Lachnospiraceae bacterium]
MIQIMITKDVFETYTYFYVDKKTNHGFLIDPGAQADRILTYIAKKSWIIEKILLTHGHFDHTGAVDSIHRSLNIPYLIHENGKKYLEDVQWNLSAYCKRNVVLKEAEYLSDRDEIALEVNKDFSLKTIYTPGHTSDSVAFYSQKDKVAFVGDTIFKGTIGSTQYVGSNVQDLQNSIAKRIFRLPSEVTLYPGHSPSTTLA